MSKQLTSEDRAVLAQLLSMNTPQSEIARRLKKDRSTIYRELSRNSGPRGYLAEEAQQRTDVRRWVNHRVRKMDDPGREKGTFCFSNKVECPLLGPSCPA
jgi:transposase, IS30 family